MGKVTKQKVFSKFLFLLTPVLPPSDVTTGVIDTGGKLAAGVNYSIQVGDSSPVSLIAVMHCELRISLQIFEKI